MAGPGRVDVTKDSIGGAAPITSIELADDGGIPLAADWRNVAAMALKNDDFVRNDTGSGLAAKVDRVGDTMTGQLTITPSTPEKALTATAGVGSDVAAIQCTGDGIGAGIAATGGANAGKGVVGIGGSTDGIGVEGIGNGVAPGIRGQSNGTGAAGVFVAISSNALGLTAQGHGAGEGLRGTGGATGPGIIATNGTGSTAAAPTKAGELQGYLHLSAPNPNAGVDPGADAVYSGSVARARGRIFLGGAPPPAFIGKPLNFVATGAITGAGTTRVTMVHPMADANYEVQLSIHGAVGYAVSETNLGGRTTTQFEFTVFSTTTGTPGVVAAEYVDIAVFGEQ